MTLTWIDEPATLGVTRHYRMATHGFGYPAAFKDVYASSADLPAFAAQFLSSYCQKHVGSPPNATKLTACTRGHVVVTDVLTSAIVGVWDSNVWHPAPGSSPAAAAHAPALCQPGYVWDPISKLCQPALPPAVRRSPPGYRSLYGLGLAPLEANARGVLILWGNTQTLPAVTNYGLQDVSLDWTERDGRMLHAFAQWRNILNWQGDMADQFGVVVAVPDQAHVDALNQWMAEQGLQLPVVQAADVVASRALLVLWGKTDGKAAAPYDDYGMQPDELPSNLAWSKRDTAMLAAFETWGNTVDKTGALDATSSAALQNWFASAAAKIPSNWTNPGAQPSGTPPPTCGPGLVWDGTNCQPLPTGVVAPPAPPAAKSNAVWWVLGGVAVVGAAVLAFGSKGVGAAVGAPVKENPTPFTERAINRLGERLGFEWLKTPARQWLEYGRKHPSAVSVRVRPGANEGRIVEVMVKPREKDLTPWQRQQSKPTSEIVVLQGKTFGSRQEAWDQASALVRSLISGHSSYENPAGYYVGVIGGNNETYGPYPTLLRAKTFARIGAQKGKHDRTVLKGGRVVRHYRAGTGESLVH